MALFDIALFVDLTAAWVSLVFGTVLNAHRDGDSAGWQGIFMLSGAIAVVVGTCAACLTRPTAEAAGFEPPSSGSTLEAKAPTHHLAGASLAQAAVAFARSGRFWCCALANVGYTCAYGILGNYGALASASSSTSASATANPCPTASESLAATSARHLALRCRCPLHPRTPHPFPLRQASPL